MPLELFTNMMLQVPALGVVVFLVIHFLSYLKSARDDERAFMSRLTQDQSSIIDRNTQALIESREITSETRETLAEVRVVLEQQASKCPLHQDYENSCDRERERNTQNKQHQKRLT